MSFSPSRPTRYQSFFQPLIDEKQKYQEDFASVKTEVTNLAKQKLANKTLHTSEIATFTQEKVKKQLNERGLSNLALIDKCLETINSGRLHPNFTQLFLEYELKPLDKEFTLQKLKSLSYIDEAIALKEILKNLIIEKSLISYLKVDYQLEKNLHEPHKIHSLVLLLGKGGDTPFFFTEFPQEPIFEHEEAYFYAISQYRLRLNQRQDLFFSQEQANPKSFWQYYHHNYRDFIKLNAFKKNLSNPSRYLSYVVDIAIQQTKSAVDRIKFNFLYLKPLPYAKARMSFIDSAPRFFTDEIRKLINNATIYLKAMSILFAFDYQNTSIRSMCKLNFLNPLDKTLYNYFFLAVFAEKEAIISAYDHHLSSREDFYKACLNRLLELKVLYSQNSDFWNLSASSEDSLSRFCQEHQNSIFDFKDTLSSYLPPISFSQFREEFKKEYRHQKNEVEQQQNLTLPLSTKTLKSENTEAASPQECQKLHENFSTVDNSLYEHSFHSFPFLEETLEETRDWERVSLRTVASFEKPFKFFYLERVTRWFTHPFGHPLPKETFPEYEDKSLQYQLKMQHYHGFSPLVDHYLSMGTELCEWKEETQSLKTDADKQKTRFIKFYGLPAKFFLENEAPQYGLLLYKMDTQSKVCMHRYFHPLESNQDLFDVFVSHEKRQRILQESFEMTSHSQPLVKPKTTSAEGSRYQVFLKKHFLEIKDLLSNSLLRVYTTKI